MEHERLEEERLVRETMQKMADEQALHDLMKAQNKEAVEATDSHVDTVSQVEVKLETPEPQAEKVS